MRDTKGSSPEPHPIEVDGPRVRGIEVFKADEGYTTKGFGKRHFSHIMPVTAFAPRLLSCLLYW